MRFAKQLLVVPYEKQLEDAIEKRPVELDKRMSDVLANNKITQDEKLKLYKQALAEFGVAEEKSEAQRIRKVDQTLQQSFLKQSIEI